MNCLFCKSELKTEYTNYIAALGKCMIVIRNVPTQVCTQCGEKSYSFEVSVCIQKLVDQVKGIVSGIAKILYTDVA